MAAVEDDLKRDEMERDNLQRIISEVETKLTVSTPGTRPVLENLLRNAKGRVVALDKKIRETEHEKEQQASNEVALNTLAQKEAALTEKEKEQYSGFLKEDFFMKKDFARLDDFYAHAWDRLSERGKDEMSHRVWEGVRRNEYKFTDLPRDVQEKEAKRVHTLLHDSTIQTSSASQIPEKDKNDFIRAYESGKMDAAFRILDRDCFKANMFRQSASTPVRHAPRNVETAAEDAAILASVKPDPPKKGNVPPKSAGAVDVSSIDLSGMTLADSTSQGAVANLPRNQGGSSRGC